MTRAAIFAAVFAALHMAFTKSQRGWADELDALDRGVLATGQAAAEALARVDELERRADLLTDHVAGLYRCMEAATAAAGIAPPARLSAYDEVAAVQARRREMRLVVSR